MAPPTALSIAGSDSGGGAGIQADLKAFAATGVHGATAITSVTSQHTRSVERVDPLPIEGIRAQIDAVFSDFDVHAVKTGMLHAPEVVDAVAQALTGKDVPVVVDPVMVATSGDALMEGDLESALGNLAEASTLITPNATELSRLTGRPASTLDDAREAARALLDDGWEAVLAKGGHFEASDTVTDLLIARDQERKLSYPRFEGVFHGAGCTYSSLTAGLLARGHGLEASVREARARMQRAIHGAYEPGGGPAVLDALEHQEPGAGEGSALSVAAWEIAAFLPRRLVPEVGVNMALAPEDAAGVEDVFALSRRLTRSGSGVTPPGPVVRGASSHVAKVVLAARHVRPEIACAVNMAYGEEVVGAAERSGLTVSRFEREEEPPEAGSTMEWGTARALKQDASADVVVDDGGVGKEAMVRILGEDTASLVEKVAGVVGEL